MQQLCANSAGLSGDGAPYEVDSIIDSRISPTNNCSEFLVRWRGYSSIWNSWEPESHLKRCPTALANFKHAQRTIEIKSEEETKDNTVNSSSLRPAQKPVELIERERARRHDPIPENQPILELVNLFGPEQKLPLKPSHPPVDSFCSHRRGSVFERFEKMMNSCGGALVTVENEMDNAAPPTHFKCLSAPILGADVPISDPSFLIGCTCHPDQCHDGKCACVSQNSKSKRAYSSDGRLLINSGPIYECNSKCSCPPSCPNRVIQRGRKVPLVIARYGPTKGWGVKAALDIPKGTFIDTYLGELITTAEATRRIAAAKHAEGSYLFDIDFNYEAGTESAYTIDAYTYGNVTHFINHSCEPNLRVHACFIDTADPSLHMLAFFATRNIAKGEELCFDYLGEHAAAQVPKGARNNRQPCSCGALKCRGFIY